MRGIGKLTGFDFSIGIRYNILSCCTFSNWAKALEYKRVPREITAAAEIRKEKV